MIKVLLGILIVGVLHEYLASFGYVSNYGLSFGLLSGVSVWILLGVMAIFGYLFGKDSYLVMIGGITNIIDRVRFGYVRDYWLIPLTSIYNNIADWILLVGIIFILIKIVWKK